MEPKQQPISFDTQGNMLIDSAHSNNYASGVNGWSINRDGSAEFNDVVIRNGDVVSGVQLFYSGTPATGNLIASISDSDGVDTFGNHYVSGITSYDFPSNEYVRFLSGEVTFGNCYSDSIDTTNVAIIARTTIGEFLVQGSITGINTVRSLFDFIPGNPLAKTGTDVTPVVILTNSEHADTAVDLALEGGGSIYPRNASWQTPAVPSPSTGWAIGTGVGGAYPDLRWRYLSQNDFKVEGVFHATSTSVTSPIFKGFPGVSGTKVSAVGTISKVGASNVSFSAYINSNGELRATALPAVAVNDTFMVNATVSLNDLV